jgi:EAL domain-containing protein (putative c-di-GMP-specific phosphodiesterase class I)
VVFIPFAEQSGQIIELGRWVLEQACADRDRWQQRRTTNVGISVNVSAHQFMSAGFASTVSGVLASPSADPGSLTLEVTESVFLRDEDRALVVLKALKALGVNLALDDFGTGYSALGYLNSLPIDVIKLDQTFIASLNDHPSSQAIVVAVIGLAHGLGMKVVSEGIETARQRDNVTRLGADSCQGVYFAKPMLASDVAALMGPGGDDGSLRLPRTVANEQATNGSVSAAL